MDSLLEKLRAAAPQARDQRDRRRRARLKEKHQVRIASGQQMPDLPLNDDLDADKGLLNPDSVADEGSGSSVADGQVSESEDIADRAANLLQGLRGDAGDGTPSEGDGALRVRRRRETADEERRNRRMRRRTAAQGSSTDGKDPTNTLSTVAEGEMPETRGKTETANGIEDDITDSNGEPATSTPVIIVSPTTSPRDGSELAPVEIPD